MFQKIRSYFPESPAIFQNFENTIRSKLQAILPAWLRSHSHYLILITIVWSLGVCFAGYLAQFSLTWLWLILICLICFGLSQFIESITKQNLLQPITQWEYFMKNILNFVFFTFLLISFAYILPVEDDLMLVVLAFIQIGFMISALLINAAHTSQSEELLSSLYTTKLRWTYGIIILFIIIFGPSFISLALPYITILMLTAFIISLYLTQKLLRKN